MTDTLGDQFGFKKIALMLTNAGKLVAVSTMDGSIMWKQYFQEEIPHKILVRNMLEKEV